MDGISREPSDEKATNNTDRWRAGLPRIPSCGSNPAGATLKRSNLRTFLIGSAVGWHGCGANSAGLDRILGSAAALVTVFPRTASIPSRRVLVQTLNRVRINARCDRRRFMSKGTRDGLQVDARCKRQRPERVAEIVESDGRAAAGGTGPSRDAARRVRMVARG